MTIQQVRNERLKRYWAAEMAVLSGQSYTIGNRTLTRADLSEIREAIDDLLAAGATLEDGDNYKVKRSVRAVFVD